MPAGTRVKGLRAVHRDNSVEHDSAAVTTLIMTSQDCTPTRSELYCWHKAIAVVTSDSLIPKCLRVTGWLSRMTGEP